MDPAQWRKKAKLSLREAAQRIGRTRMTVSRYESGEREAPNSIVMTYARESDGEVTAADFNRVRKRYLRALEVGATKAA